MLTIGLMFAATVGVIVTSPSQVTAAFGPIILNLQLAVLAAVGLLCRYDLPSARRCRRSPGKKRDAEVGS